MPFPYQASAQPVRTRRVKDKDGRSTNSRSDSGKRPKESSSNHRTSPQHSLRPAQPSLYTQHNVTLDQLPALPGSGTASPSPPSPSLHSASSIPAVSPTSAVASAVTTISQAHLHTPAALQPYLDQEDDEEPRIADISPLKSSLEEKAISRVRSESPKISNPYPESLKIIPHSTPSPKSAQTSLYRSPSPPPRAPSPFWNQPYNSQSHPAQPFTNPGNFDPVQPYSQNFNYVTSPPAFTQAGPYLSGAGEQYYGPSYGGQPYMPMTQSAASLPDHQLGPPQPVQYYTNYGSPQQVQAPYHPMRNSSIRGRSSTGSRRSFSGEPFPTTSLAMANPPEQHLPVEGPVSSGQCNEDESVELLHRIQSAIPDLHLLLDRYKETSGQLGVRETLIRETEAQKAAALKQKEAYIEKLGKEIELVTSKHSAESSKLRLEIGNMEEKHKELQDSLVTEKKVKSDLEASNRTLRAEKDQAERKLQDDTAALKRDRAAWHQKMLQDQAARQAAWEADAQQQKQELEAKWRTREAKSNEDWLQERIALQAGWSRQKREIENAHIRLRQELEATLELRQKAVDEGYLKQSQDREAWEKEREALSRTWGDERALLGKGTEEQREILGAQHQREKDDLLKRWEASQARANQHAEELQMKLRKENERLKGGWDADKAKFAKAIMDLKGAAAKLNDENAKLQKMTEAFGDITDLKSREDPFYDDSFRRLHQQILDLTCEHFRDHINAPPDSIAKSIPRTIPPFFSSSEPSIKLRAAYVEHLVSSIITHRIFKPFLFTLSLRHGSSDKLFQNWSEHMRSKSTRKEALWRQRTLHAAYTVSCAKQSINKIAALIVDEIVDAIKHFTNPGRWDQLTMAVRRIVKTAAETWRYARLEIPMITASMSEEHRPEFMRSNNIGGLTTTTESTSGHRQKLLPLFPIIEREAIHEDIREDSKSNDNGHIYFSGRVLYADDQFVIDCQAETQHNEMSVVSREANDMMLENGDKKLSPEIGGLVKKADIQSTSSLVSKESSSQVDGLQSASNGARSDIWEEMDMNPTLAGRSLADKVNQRKASNGSSSHTPPLSHSSETSGSSTWRSSSTTRPDGLPHWGNKGGINRGGYGPW